MKRTFDILFSFLGLVVLSLFLLIIACCIKFDSQGSVFYRQLRVGRNRLNFYLYKFRTMVAGADKSGRLTIGERDSRITRMGYFLRKSKLDELPQLFNVLVGEMSIVGPRPEVPEYVQLYTEEQLQVLSIRPGITDYASIEYADENKILGRVDDPEELYIKEIMPAKLALNLRYLEKKNTLVDLGIIFRTLVRILR